MNNTYGICVDGSSNVYAADSTGGSNSEGAIMKYTGSGAPVTQWNEMDPVAVAADGNGNIYVSDYGNGSILKFTNTGTWVKTYGSFGSGPGQFKGPIGVAVNSAGTTCYVADTSNNRVVAFAP